MAPAHESETIDFNFRKLLSTLPNYAELEQILLFSVNWGKQACRTKDRVTRTPLKTGGELRCSGRVSSSCSTCGTRRVNLVTNLVISRE